MNTPPTETNSTFRASREQPQQPLCHGYSHGATWGNGHASDLTRCLHSARSPFQNCPASQNVQKHHGYTTSHHMALLHQDPVCCHTGDTLHIEWLGLEGNIKIVELQLSCPWADCSTPHWSAQGSMQPGLGSSGDAPHGMCRLTHSPAPHQPSALIKECQSSLW